MIPAESPPERTPLHDLHQSWGGRLVAFAGYALPVQYPAGIVAEHLHTRAAASLFDVSHMGQIEVRPAAGRFADAALALERLTAADVAGIAPGRQRYALLTDPDAGILDDLMIANLGDRLLVVANAARKADDLAHLQAALGTDCEVRLLPDRALIALQGPGAETALAALAPEVRAMRFLDVRELDILGATCTVSRSGYTGEDGFEIGAPADQAPAIALALMDRPGVAPAGLGARDSLRLEAGLCLHGADIGPDTTPVEAGLEWSVGRARRPGGERAGGYPGADLVAGQLAHGPPRRRVGLRPEGRAPVRGGAPLFDAEDAPDPIGAATSGCFGPSVGAPVALGYIAAGQSVPGTLLFAEVRGARLPVRVAPLPFVTPTFKR
jgi:aminomethyltransferase